LEEQDVLSASAMHGHMIEFKKRGGWLRNRARRALGLAAPNYGLDPHPVGASRVLVECVISTVFLVCRTPPARWLMDRIPKRILGPVFNRSRLFWNRASKPAKRTDLRMLTMKPRDPLWRSSS